MNSTPLKVRNVVIYGEEERALTPHFVHCEKIDMGHPKLNGHVKPHQHSHLVQIILIESGITYFRSESMEIRVDKPCIITIPENTVHEVKPESDLKGRVITFSTNLLEELVAFFPEGLQKFEKIRLIQNSSDAKGVLTAFDIGKKIEDELLLESPERELFLRSYLSLILGTIVRLITNSNDSSSKLKRSNYTYFNSFRRNIKQSGISNKPLKEYAAELDISPTHLNRICKAVIGKPASQVVQEYILLEAKKQLKYTSQTVSEISYMLNFNDPGYFGRFFKKHTGVSPKEYRDAREELLNK